MSDIITTHKGFTIKFYEFGGEGWEVQDKGELGTFQNEKLSVCKEWIDKKLEAEKKREKAKFVRKKAFDYVYGISIKTVTVTSDAGCSHGKQEYWITDGNKNRYKTLSTSLMEYDNDIAEKFTVIDKEIDELGKKKKELIKTLKPFIPETNK